MGSSSRKTVIGGVLGQSLWVSKGFGNVMFENFASSSKVLAVIIWTVVFDEQGKMGEWKNLITV